MFREETALRNPAAWLATAGHGVTLWAMMKPACGAWVLGLLVLGGCGKVQSYVAPSVAVADSDPIDDAAVLLLGALARGDFDQLASHTADPLTHDMSRAEFDDLAKIVQWLGPLRSRSERSAETDVGLRAYELQFERGAAVDLEVSIDPTGRLIGFVFSGKGYTEAERGVLAEPWREFKVYDFWLLDAEGNRLPKDTPVRGTRVEYEVIVGGIEALLGVHHLRVEKSVQDARGIDVFREPIEFDTTFDQDAMGVPRGTVRGFVEVPGPGTWTMDLRISDENAHRDIYHEHPF